MFLRWLPVLVLVCVDKEARFRDAVAREHNFRVVGHRLIITGVCQECSSKRHRRQSPLDLI